MKIHTLEAGKLKLDGGAMFGIVPKRMWNKMNPADTNNLCTWIMRSLLIETGDRIILMDTGMGNKFDEKFASFFEPHGKDIRTSLKKLDFSPEDITDVFLTHLHFDHCGGATIINSDGKIVPTFPNAVYWSNQVHYDWALEANPREAASFIQDNFVPLQKAGVLKFIDVQKEDIEWMPGINVRFLYGHTRAMMMPIISTPEEEFVYTVDLMPSQWHIRVPYIMAYDIQPMVTLEEKKRVLQDAVDKNHTFIFEHDPVLGQSKIVKDSRGRFNIRN